MNNSGASVRWNRDTKFLVTVIALLVIVALAYLARNVIPLIALAAVIAYILQPAVGWLERHRLPRGLGTALCLLLLIVFLALLPVLLTPPTVNGVRSIIDVLIQLPEELDQWTTDIIERQPTISLGGVTLDLAATLEEMQSSTEEAMSQFRLPSLSALLEYTLTGLRTAGGIVETAAGIASTVVSAAFSTLLLAVLIFFLTKDGRRAGSWLQQMILPEYQPEMIELGRRLDLVWKSFFRGQLLLALVVGAIVFVATSLLGLPGALVLGILAGVLEVIPNLGPVLALIPAVLVALVQGSNTLPVSNLVFALIVVGVYVLIQQIENNFLVPRIMGQSLNLHPLFVLVGVVVGASFAGVLGAFLAAPVLASLKVLGLYAHAKITDQDPLSEPPITLAVVEPLESWLARFKRLLSARGNSPAPVETGAVPDETSDPATLLTAAEREEQA
ncbi:MAG TPA: AI-2E family transporter [Anaerolineae bacterium]|nr:AI-2E family transporter [Anaerolineae bacterium]